MIKSVFGRVFRPQLCRCVFVIFICKKCNTNFHVDGMCIRKQSVHFFKHLSCSDVIRFAVMVHIKQKTNRVLTLVFQLVYILAYFADRRFVIKIKKMICKIYPADFFFCRHADAPFRLLIHLLSPLLSDMLCKEEYPHMPKNSFRSRFPP